jgi:hypothetical protein
MLKPKMFRIGERDILEWKHEGEELWSDSICPDLGEPCNVFCPFFVVEPGKVSILCRLPFVVQVPTTKIDILPGRGVN